MTFVQKNVTREQNHIIYIMNIISMLWCWLKVRAVGLSTEDFFALCNMFDRKKSKIAEYALKAYFNSHTPEKQWLKHVYDGSDELKYLYFENIRRGRRLMPYEQEWLVQKMPISRFSRFPAALDKVHQKMLFEKSALPKLIAYVHGFVLPPDLEHLLIDLCAKEGNDRPFGNSYHMALWTYVSSLQKNKFQTPALQLSLLALNDDEITIELVKNCSMETNILFIPTMQQLAESGSREVLNELLFNTFVVSDELSRKILGRFPDLRWAYEISRLRKPLRKLEREIGFFGVEAPSIKESDFILKSVEMEKDKVRKVIPEVLSRDDVTPYFCAWVASEFPEYAEKAYRNVRKTAEKCREIYKLKEK